MSGDNLQLMTAQQMLIKHIQIHRDTLAQEFSGAPLLSGQIDWEGESPKFHELAKIFNQWIHSIVCQPTLRSDIHAYILQHKKGKNDSYTVNFGKNSVDVYINKSIESWLDIAHYRLQSASLLIIVMGLLEKCFVGHLRPEDAIQEIFDESSVAEHAAVVCENIHQCASIEEEWNRLFDEFYCIAANPVYTQKLNEIIQQLSKKINPTGHSSELDSVDKGCLIILKSISTSIKQCLSGENISFTDRSYRSWSVLDELKKYQNNSSNEVLLSQTALRKLMREISRVIKKAESLKANSNVSESQKLQLSQAIVQLTKACEALNQFDQGKKVHNVDPDYRQPFRAKLQQIKSYKSGSVKYNSDLVDEIDEVLRQKPAKEKLLKEITDKFKLLKSLKTLVLSSKTSNDLVKACGGKVSASAGQDRKENSKLQILEGKWGSPTCLLKGQFKGFIEKKGLAKKYSGERLYEKYTQMMQLLDKIKSWLSRMDQFGDQREEHMTLDQLTTLNDKLMSEVNEIELASGELLGRESRKVMVRGIFADTTMQASPDGAAAAIASGTFSPRSRKG